jgi:L-methionine (R)-S-oxide reductase
MQQASVHGPGAHLTKRERYAGLRATALSLVDGEGDWLPNLANVAAAVYAAVPGLTWAGFYLMRGGELVVGPFQGLPACVRIAVGRGVCGTAVAERATQVVPDVHAFDGHIACDPRARSEIVVPIVLEGSVVGVLDLDSDRPAHFDDDDRAGLEALVEALAPRIDWAGATVG